MTLDELDLQRWLDDGGCYKLDVAFASDAHAAFDQVAAVYTVLAKHQVTENWDDRELLAWLHEWAKVFIFEFKLKISTFALSIEFLSANRLGHFRHGHNGFGLKGEIAINRRYLQRDAWRILGTLLHELLHAEQEENGKPGKRNYHNKAFRERAAELGLIIDQYGHTQYAPISHFRTLLVEMNTEMPELPPPLVHECGKSKLKLWMCPCGIRARVAVADFRAQCLRCQGSFVAVES